MKPKHGIILCIFSCCIFSSAHAQIEKLLKNKDITWVAETEDVFLLDNITDKDHSLNRFVNLKILNDEKTFSPDNGSNLILQIKRAADKNLLEIYSDRDLKEKIPNQNPFSKIDTVEVIDPETYEKKIKIVESTLDLDMVLGFKLKNILYYNAAKSKFDIIPLAIAPLIINIQSEDNSDVTLLKNKLVILDPRTSADSIIKILHVLSPMCWIKLKNYNSVPNLASNDINWAMRYTNRNGFAENDFNILKSTKGSVFNQFLEKAITDKKLLLLDSERKSISQDDRHNLFYRYDTIEVIDPNTFEKKINVVKSTINSEACDRLRLTYDWFWDRKRNQLIVKLLSVAPMCKVYDEAGNFLFSRGLFYLLNERK